MKPLKKHTSVSLFDLEGHGIGKKILTKEALELINQATADHDNSSCFSFGNRFLTISDLRLYRKFHICGTPLTLLMHVMKANGITALH